MFTKEVGPGMELRELRESDAEALLAHLQRNQEHLSVWLPELTEMTTVEDTRAFIQEGLDSTAKGTGRGLSIWAHGQLIGVLGLGAISSETRSAMIGYWLDGEYQGRGLMTQAVRVLIQLAFEELGLNRVEITCPHDHPASRHIPERLGFKEEGTRRQTVWIRDQPHDEVIYGLLASEWSSAGAAPQALS
jgi:ribosomal-protein-serine acetyltransferase